MSLSLYDASIPGFIRMMSNLAHMMDKAEAYAAEAGVPLSALVEANLGHGMGNFARQIQFASDAAKSGAARLAGVEPPSMPDTETTFPELRERIAKTIAFAQTIRPDQVDGQEDREVVLKFPGGSITFTGRDFLLTFNLPNFHFHVTTAYDILRSQGVPLNKMDYISGGKAPA